MYIHVAVVLYTHIIILYMYTTDICTNMTCIYYIQMYIQMCMYILKCTCIYMCTHNSWMQKPSQKVSNGQGMWR